jgi:hypothetical protein
MKTKWFRVASSGKTVDGREITPAQIDQMAASYNPATYGARIWVEHLRSLLPDSPFKAYGDVLAVRAEDGGDGKRVLMAQVDATEDLMGMQAKRQKVYWSIEMDPNFQGTGQAYMVGLACTDSPASTGTEMLKFSLQTPDKMPEQVKGHLFSEHVEAPIETDDDRPSIFARVKEMLAGQSKVDTARFGQVEAAVTAIAEEVAGIKTTIAGFSAGGKGDPQLVGKVETLSADLAALKSLLAQTGTVPQRPKAGGGGSNFSTDC